MAWDANSGLSWEQKFHVWVGSLERDGRTFKLTTPFGKTLGAPALECAETAMFLRIAFASWYELPFFIEAHDGGRVFLGHMGIITVEGNRWNGTPNFNNFDDFSNLADEVRENPDAWPRDNKLRQKSILGTSSDDQPAIDEENAGAYFDEIFLNKRVGYFLVKQLGFNGSVHLADSANTYNLRADGFDAGDFLVERFGRTGIGHTIVIKSVKEIGTAEIDFETYKTREAEVVSGTMPRRQGLWEGPSAGKRFYFTSDAFGGDSTVDFGSGLKRFRSPVNIGGKWTNSVLPEDAGKFINSNSRDKLVERQTIYETILVERTLEERRAEILQNVEFQRDHLRNFPSSCSARTRREQAFQGLYDLGIDTFESPEEIDRKFRKLEDYVFAELEYEVSKTCCWNSSTNAMYQATMLYNQCLLGEIDDAASCTGVETNQQCSDIRVFKANANDGDGYQEFRDFATQQGFNFVAWSADESCPQAGVSEDTMKDEQPTPLCDLIDDIR